MESLFDDLEDFADPTRPGAAGGQASPTQWPAGAAQLAEAVELVLGRVHPEWLELWRNGRGTSGELIIDTWRSVLGRVVERAAVEQVLPGPDEVARAFRRSVWDTKVIILGQDPYPTPGHGMGLSFSVRPEVRPLPRSLNNIFEELQADWGEGKPRSGDLSAWADQGVMLLNTTLTVPAGNARGHTKLGWPELTRDILINLMEQELPLVVVAWGNDAWKTATTALLRAFDEKLEITVGEAVREPRWFPAEVPAPMDSVQLGPVIILGSAHPSPLSARRGFFGSRPFSTVNAALELLGEQPIDWGLES